LTSSCAVLNRIRAVNNTSITANTDITLLAADNGLAANVEGKLSAATRSTARILEAESGLGTSTSGVKSTSEALGTSRSSESLETGKSSVVIGVIIVAIVVVVGVDPLAVVRTSISSARTATSSSQGAASSRAGAEFFVFGRRAGTSEETAALTLTPVERISIAVVRNVPTSRFKESEGEFGHLHLDDKTGGHGFVGELSSFEVRSGSTRRSGILHVSTLERRASEVLSKSAGKGLSIDDSSGITIKSS